MADKLDTDTATRFAKAVEAGVPDIYANGFAMALTSGDVMIVFERNGGPVATMNLSYTLTKTLALKCAQTVSNFERSVGREILTTDEVDAFMTGTEEKR